MQFPVEEVLPDVLRSLAENRPVVLRSPPGSGKTTCLPPAVAEADWLGGRKILVLEPRRLAARTAARYVAAKYGEAVGGRVGYSVRLEREVSSRTRIEFLTEGLLAQRILHDPEMKDVGAVIFDEFHERSLACDLGFALTLEVRSALRPDLRMVVMSATFDTEAIATLLDHAAVHTAESRMYPIETRYLEVSSSAPIWAQAAGAVRRLVRETSGSILVFLPGEGEIRRCAEELRDVPDVYPLYGALSKEEQDAAVSAGTSRKIVLATSIAETSLTVPGVTAVIDCGLMRVSRFSPASGMSRLETLRLTRDRADQRRGRAGRTAPGICLRLWTEAEDRLLLPAAKPEILEADLAGTVLASASWGAPRATDLPWPTPPTEGNWARARTLLEMLGALDASGRVTEHGAKMSRIPAHPRLANMMLCGGDAIWAAMIEEGVPHRVTDIRDARPTPRMRELARRWHIREAGRVTDAGEALALAFPDRIARNRGNGTFTMVSGRGAVMDKAEPLSASEYLVCCELDDRGGDALIRLAAPLNEETIEALYGDRIQGEMQVTWDARAEAVSSRAVRLLGRMPVGTTGRRGEPSAEALAAAMIEGIRRKGVANLPCWTPHLRSLQARICFLSRVLGEPWPDVSDKALAEHADTWLGPFLGDMTRWSHLAQLDLGTVFNAILSEAGCERRQLDRLAPERMDVPSGSSIAIHYDAETPYAKVRLQECFGMTGTPHLAEGRVAVVMQLLSPAQRPVQVTQDLAGFWRNSYPLVRKDMRGRYPKHYWPEDPLTAIATRRVRPKEQTS